MLHLYRHLIVKPLRWMLAALKKLSLTLPPEQLAVSPALTDTLFKLYLSTRAWVIVQLSPSPSSTTSFTSTQPSPPPPVSPLETDTRTPAEQLLSVSDSPATESTQAP